MSVTTVPLRSFCVHLGFCPLLLPLAISSHTSLRICADKEGWLQGLRLVDSNRLVRPLASGPDGERDHWRPRWRALGRERVGRWGDGGWDQTGLRQVWKYLHWLFWWWSLCKSTPVSLQSVYMWFIQTGSELVKWSSNGLHWVLSNQHNYRKSRLIHLSLQNKRFYNKVSVCRSLSHTHTHTHKHIHTKPGCWVWVQ